VSVERRRVQNEIREDDPLGSFDYFAKRRVWGDTTLSRPISGTVTGVAKIGLDRLGALKEEAFQSQNLCFYVTGSFTGENLLHLVGQVGLYGIGRGEDVRLTYAPLPQDFMKRDCAVVLQDSRDMPSVYYSFDVDFSRYTMAEAYLLDDIIFRGTLSRLSMALSEDTGLIYSHEAYLDQYRNYGTVYVKFFVMKSKLDEAVRLATGVFRSMKESITEADLALHMPKYSDNYDFTIDDPEDLNWNMAFHNFILGDDLRSIEHIKSLYRAVTPGRLMQMAGEIFRPENLVVAIRAPKNRCKAERMREILSTL
jgi:predicted Zn-dependent peptidase